MSIQGVLIWATSRSPFFYSDLFVIFWTVNFAELPMSNSCLQCARGCTDSIGGITFKQRGTQKHEDSQAGSTQGASFFYDFLKRLVQVYLRWTSETLMAPGSVRHAESEKYVSFNLRSDLDDLSPSTLGSAIIKQQRVLLFIIQVYIMAASSVCFYYQEICILIIVDHSKCNGFTLRLTLEMDLFKPLVDDAFNIKCLQ